mmetsp:Transcript_3353/g.7935  ORF Transcript_3353/g.7935 Transcript_3353/m.7935 type:complete len:1186 (-) Transcript_3353:1130-4687(-)
MATSIEGTAAVPATPPPPSTNDLRTHESWMMWVGTPDPAAAAAAADTTTAAPAPNSTPLSPYGSHTTMASTPTGSLGSDKDDKDTMVDYSLDKDDDDCNDVSFDSVENAVPQCKRTSSKATNEMFTQSRPESSVSSSSSAASSPSPSSSVAAGDTPRRHHESSSEVITLLGEIVGARDLRVPDEDQLDGGADGIKSLRPYAVISYAGKRIHKTDKCNKEGPNPIWSPSTKSFFLLRTSAKEMSQSTLNVSIYSKKKENSLSVSLMTSSSIFLGQVNIDAAAVLDHCDEERREYILEDEIGETVSKLGHFAVRFKVATLSDVDVVSFFNKKPQPSVNTSFEPSNRLDTLESKKTTAVAAGPFQRNSDRPLAPLVTETSEAEIAQSGFVNALSSVFSRNVKTDESGVTKVRVKPGPDPDRQQETEFLSSHDLKIETRLPSKKWIEAGSGTLGKLYVEILSCHGLPNVDLGEAVGDVTDPFCTLVFEDCCCMTDVIDDELSPHWMPWTKRAFAFNMMHPASTLYLGIFDYDLGMGDHDAIGRVAVPVCNLQRDTIHTLKYNLYPSSNVTARAANGSIVIRLRVEWYDEREALLTALKPRPKIHINVTKPKSFKVIRYTCFGEYDNEEQFDLTVTRSYINEIFQYKSSIGYLLGDAFRSLMFWRGQVEVFSILLPVHSLLFFLMATRLVERPSLIVPFTFLGIGWALLAMLTVRRQSPSPWNRCPSFVECHRLLLTGRTSTPLHSIKENEGAEAAKKIELEWQKRIDDDLKIAEKKAELNQIINEIGDDNIHTNVSQGVIPLDMLNRLARYQGIIRRLCDKFRFIKIIFTWEESMVSFWLTTAFLGVGLVSLLLPWGFILTWVGRFLVWGLFGPHMKLVDLTLRAKSKSGDSLETIMKGFDIQKMLARERRERALKIKDIKEAAFGKYSVQIPSFNLARHFDRPLPESSGRVCRKGKSRNCGRSSRRLSVVDISKEGEPWIPGQQLYGDLIPRPEYDISVYEQEVAVQEKAMRKFRARVKKIKNADGISQVARKVLARLGHDEGSPMAFGYEVALEDTLGVDDNDDDGPYDEKGQEQNHEEKHENTRDHHTHFKSLALGARLTVRMTSDKKQFISKRDLNQVVLAVDGNSTYCVSDDKIPEEVGMEVIGTGRFSAFDDDELHQSESDDSRLLYRPDDSVGGGNGKQKEE